MNFYVPLLFFSRKNNFSSHYLALIGLFLRDFSKLEFEHFQEKFLKIQKKYQTCTTLHLRLFFCLLFWGQKFSFFDRPAEFLWDNSMKNGLNINLGLLIFSHSCLTWRSENARKYDEKFDPRYKFFGYLIWPFDQNSSPCWQSWEKSHKSHSNGNCPKCLIALCFSSREV